MRLELLLVQNIRVLLQGRGLSQRDLAKWVGHHETWLSKILKADRGLKLKEVDRVADFFGMEAYQLLSPGISVERRRGQRRSGRERREATDRRQAPPRPTTRRR